MKNIVFLLVPLVIFSCGKQSEETSFLSSVKTEAKKENVADFEPEIVDKSGIGQENFFKNDMQAIVITENATRLYDPPSSSNKMVSLKLGETFDISNEVDMLDQTLWIRLFSKDCSTRGEECKKKSMGWVEGKNLALLKDFTPAHFDKEIEYTYSVGDWAIKYKFSVEGKYKSFYNSCENEACATSRGGDCYTGDVLENDSGFCVTEGRVFANQNALVAVNRNKEVEDWFITSKEGEICSSHLAYNLDKKGCTEY